MTLWGLALGFLSGFTGSDFGGSVVKGFPTKALLLEASKKGCHRIFLKLRGFQGIGLQGSWLGFGATGLQRCALPASDYLGLGEFAFARWFCRWV